MKIVSAYLKYCWLLFFVSIHAATATGTILVQDYTKKMYSLNVSGQRVFQLPANPGTYGKLFFNSNRELILARSYPLPARIWIIKNEKNGTRSFDFARKQVRHNRIIHYKRWLANSKTHVYTGLDNYSTVLFTVNSSKRKTVKSLNKYRNKLFNYDIAPSGAFLAVHNPYFYPSYEKKYSSRHFGDMLKGYPQRLIYSQSINGKPKTLLKRKAIYLARFTADWQKIVFLSAVEANPGRNFKKYKLETVNLKTGKTVTVTELKIPLRLKNGRLNLGNPRLYICRSEPLVVHITGKKNITVYNLNDKTKRSIPVQEGFQPVFPLPDRMTAPHNGRTIQSPVLIFKKWISRGKYRLKAVSISGGQTLAQRIFEGQSVLSAAWIPDGDNASNTNRTTATGQDPYENNGNDVDPYENDS